MSVCAPCACLSSRERTCGRSEELPQDAVEGDHLAACAAQLRVVFGIEAEVDLRAQARDAERGGVAETRLALDFRV